MTLLCHPTLLQRRCGRQKANELWLTIHGRTLLDEFAEALNQAVLFAALESYSSAHGKSVTAMRLAGSKNCQRSAV